MDLSLGVSMNILKTSTLKKHVQTHTPFTTLKDVLISVFGTGRSANSIYFGLALRKQHNLQNAMFYEDCFAKIQVLHAHLTYKGTCRLW